ncbi:JmjC domain-containing protein D [Diplonema papillatum]|nr:JmjC domain-containing protein D [Diplonema papillatum]
MLSLLFHRMRLVALRHRRRMAVTALFIAVVMVLSLKALLYSNIHQHTDGFKREQIRKLRAALAANMKAFTGKDIGATFVPKHRIERLSTLNPKRFNDYTISSLPFILSSPDYTCTTHHWSTDYIREVAGDDVVGVETSKSNRFYANEGLQKVRMSVSTFLDSFRREDRGVDMYLAEEDIRQFPALDGDVSVPSFCEQAQIDKVQLWIGAGGQVSPLHHDQWDNVLCQIEGKRSVALFDPLQSDRLYPKTDVNRHFAQVDPEHPDLAKFPDFEKAVSFNVTLHAGEILFIPAHWWHQVHHSNLVNVAVNFWFLPNLLSELLMDTILPEGDNYA